MDDFKGASYLTDDGAGETESYAAPAALYSPASRKNFRFINAARDSAQDRVVADFSRLNRNWRRETMLESSTSKLYFHVSYQKIIGMGRPALPLILKELRDNGGYWFWALECITGANPVSKEMWGNYDARRNAWLKWASRRIAY